MIGIEFEYIPSHIYCLSKILSAKSDEHRGKGTEADLQMCMARPEQRAG